MQRTKSVATTMEEEGRFFAANEAVPLLKRSSISEYLVMESGILPARDSAITINDVTSLATPIFHPSLFYLPSVYAVSKGFLLLRLTFVLTRGR